MDIKSAENCIYVGTNRFDRFLNILEPRHDRHVWLITFHRHRHATCLSLTRSHGLHTRIAKTEGTLGCSRFSCRGSFRRCHTCGDHRSGSLLVYLVVGKGEQRGALRSSDQRSSVERVAPTKLCRHGKQRTRHGSALAVLEDLRRKRRTDCVGLDGDDRRARGDHGGDRVDRLGSRIGSQVLCEAK